jgi:glycosyltransferase involved in cell wall biosynthesis
MRSETPLSAAETRARFALGSRRVLLSLSAKRPHKNLAALIDALAMLPSSVRPILVLPGYPTRHEQELRERAAAKRVAEDVRFAGWLSGAEIEGLWAVAEVFVLPSLYEGFGLPVLEAMARRTPVIASNRSSIPEVARDAAILLDPEDVEALGDAMRRFASEPGLRAELTERGAEVVTSFSWDETARLTIAAYEELRATR